MLASTANIATSLIFPAPQVKRGNEAEILACYRTIEEKTKALAAKERKQHKKPHIPELQFVRIAQFRDDFTTDGTDKHG